MSEDDVSNLLIAFENFSSLDESNDRIRFCKLIFKTYICLEATFNQKSCDVIWHHKKIPAHI